MRLWGAVVLVCLAGAAQLHAQAAPATEGYDDIVREAVREFDAGNYVEARTLFQRAHAQKPSARTLRGLGICSYELKHYLQAVNELDAALADTRHPLTVEQHDEVSRTVEKARRFVGKLVLDVAPRNATVVVDGNPLASLELALEAGVHTLTASAARVRGSEQKFTLEGGQTLRSSVKLLPLDLQPEHKANGDRSARSAGATGALSERDARDQPGLPSKWWFWTVAGVVVAGAAVGTAFAVSSGREPAQANAGTSGVLLKVP